MAVISRRDALEKAYGKKYVKMVELECKLMRLENKKGIENTQLIERLTYKHELLAIDLEVLFGEIEKEPKAAENSQKNHTE